MAIASAYLTVKEYRDRVDQTDSAKDEIVRHNLLAISRLIEEETGQFYNIDAAVTDRLFQAKWSDRLDLDYEGNCPGIATTTGLVIKVDTDGDGSFADETAWTINTDFRVLPTDAALRPQPCPWNTIITIGSKSFPVDKNHLVQVTAKFGWPSVPEVIKELTAKWCSIWRLDGPEGTGRISELGQVTSISLDVKRLLDKAAHYGNARVTL